MQTILYSINGSHLFKMTDNLSLELSGFYNSSTYNGTVKTGRFGSLNAGIKKELKKQAILQLSVYDMLSTIKYRNDYGILTPEAFNGKSTSIFYPESRKFPIIRLTYSMSFGGNAKVRQKRESEESESKRIITQ
ncbi:outer membrane beta-barrel protein [Olivibacter sitiensis]|uniref:outer membrane beta-barrel protein n=1 Tax=Olivibacter sitiensis TaxID=376470 RepID=UPI000481850F|nr:outer membrane beta-barrel protein [Olivibacter sitiensis]